MAEPGVPRSTRRFREPSLADALIPLLTLALLIAGSLALFSMQALSPTWYYVASAVICGEIALSIGSSCTTAGTIGVVLVGIATMLEVSATITAGAVISGAYLGDTLSPLSETPISATGCVHRLRQ